MLAGMVIGVSGKYCSGKDTAVRFLGEEGFREIDVDRIGHGVLEELKEEIAAEFGSSILDARKNVDRGKLGSVVFADRAKLSKLESIVHPLMVDRVKEQMGGEKTAINAAVLFRMVAPLFRKRRREK